LAKGLILFFRGCRRPHPLQKRRAASRARFLWTQIDRQPVPDALPDERGPVGQLAASISSNGVVQPILVRPLANGRFQLIAGERRWRASALAARRPSRRFCGRSPTSRRWRSTIVENLQRADLNPMEQARAFERLSREFHMTAGADGGGAHRKKIAPTVANFLRFVAFTCTVAEPPFESGELSFGQRRTPAGF